MLKLATSPAAPERSGRVIAIARFLRTPQQYALPFATPQPEGDDA